MTITHRLSDALAAARHASALHGKLPASPSSAAGGADTMAPLAMTPLAPPLVSTSASSPHASPHTSPARETGDDGALPGMVPTARRELFDRSREELLTLLAQRDFGALPPSWAAISGRLSQEEAASAAAALQLIAARVTA